MLQRNAHETIALNSAIEIHWTPAHSQLVPGNEAADRAAKEATGWRESGPRQNPSSSPSDLKSLISASKTAVRDRTIKHSGKPSIGW